MLDIVDYLVKDIFGQIQKYIGNEILPKIVSAVHWPQESTGGGKSCGLCEKSSPSSASEPGGGATALDLEADFEKQSIKWQCRC